MVEQTLYQTAKHPEPADTVDVEGPLGEVGRPTTVFYDGACPLCLKEIGLLKRLDKTGALAFENVADPDAAPSCDISRETLLARFHVRKPDGEIIDGALAFFEAWGRLPRLGFLRTLARVEPLVWLTERAYRVFLKVRPSLQRLAR